MIHINIGSIPHPDIEPSFTRCDPFLQPVLTALGDGDYGMMFSQETHLTPSVPRKPGSESLTVAPNHSSSCCRCSSEEGDRPWLCSQPCHVCAPSLLAPHPELSSSCLTDSQPRGCTRSCRGKHSALPQNRTASKNRGLACVRRSQAGRQAKGTKEAQMMMQQQQHL